MRQREPSSIFVFYRRRVKSQVVATIRLFKFVRAVDFDALVPSLQGTDVGPAEYIPRLLEHLLVEHPTAVFVEMGEWTGDEALSTVLTVAESHGEVIVPSKTLAGRSRKLNPAVAAEFRFSLVAYTRSGFIERIKPHLDCRRGISCAAVDGVGVPRIASILRRGYVGLHKTDPRALPRMTALAAWKVMPYTVDTFEALHGPDHPPRTSQESATLLRIGLGLESRPEEDVDDFTAKRLGPLLRTIEGQEREGLLVIIYIVNYSSDPRFKETLRRTVVPSSVLLKVATDTAREADGFVKQMTAMAALDDGCRQFHQFGLGAKIPQAGTNWLKYLVQHGRLPYGSLTLVTWVGGEEDVWMLKEIVGSIHGSLAMKPMLPPPRLMVLGRGLSGGNVEMIRLWQHVEYLDLGVLLFGTEVEHKLSMETTKVRIVALDAIIRRGGPAVWVSPKIAVPDTAALEELEGRLMRDGHVLGAMSIEGRQEVVVEGYDPEAFERILGPRLSCLRGHRRCASDADPLAGEWEKNRTMIDAAQMFRFVALVPKPAEDKRSQNYCHLMIRPEVMYNPVAFMDSFPSLWGRGEVDAGILRGSTKTKIALLIPTKNKPGSVPREIHLVKNFVKSLVSSITGGEWSQFQYSLYLGYDRDDPVLDKKRDELQQVISELAGPHTDSLLVKYHLLPTAKCVTLLWNMLFLDALHDGNDYFYQINDDVTIVSPGWSTSFVSKLRKSNDVGVVGPNDYLWRCRLLTQSFVSRKHHEIFGWYFPTEIKDWFSDNWITAVYGASRTQCDSKMYIKNSNAATRYHVCSEPRWRENVMEGQKRIVEWARENDRRLLHDMESGNSTVHP